MSQLIERARRYAQIQHASQVRKFSGAPYFVHPEAVARIVSQVPHTEAMIAASFLHDTVEDTSATHEEIERLFGRQTGSLVRMLSDVSCPQDGPRALRKQIDRAHSAAACPQAKTIKLGDIIDNTRTIAYDDPVFAQIYLQEKAELLAVLIEGDKTLHRVASLIIQHGLAVIDERRRTPGPIDLAAILPGL